MCTWCGKDYGVKAQVSGYTYPMVCRRCGGDKKFLTYREMNKMLYAYEAQIKILEKALLRMEKNSNE